MTIGDQSIMKPLLIFYVLLLLKHTDKLINKRIIEFVESNKFVQHILGFTLLTLLIMMCGNDDVETALIQSSIGYMVFVMSTKMNINVGIFMFVLLCFGYGYETILKKKITQLSNDRNVDDAVKDLKCKKYRLLIRYFWILVIIIIFVGSGMYSIKKSMQHNCKYDLCTFFFE